MSDVIKADSSIMSILASGERDPYIIQDKLKQSGLFSPLARIKEKINKFEEEENIKFSSNLETDKRFNWIINFFSDGQEKKAYHLKKKLYGVFYRELEKHYLKDNEINSDIKKKAADVAISETSNTLSILKAATTHSSSVYKDIGIGAATTLLPAALYKLLKGESIVDALPAGTIGAILGYGYHNLPEDIKINLLKSVKPNKDKEKK